MFEIEEVLDFLFSCMLKFLYMWGKFAF